MKINKDDIKKRIIYRASYRGTKEMDVLMSSFVKSIINKLNEEELLDLEKFVNFDQTKNEIEYRLEQLRALDNDIKINVALAKSSPIGIDTEEDYLALKKIMEYKS